MAKKTFRTIYLNDELDSLLVKQAEKHQSSVSRLVRIAVERHFKNNGTDNAGASGGSDKTAAAMEA